jgi:hypothetical protein
MRTTGNARTALGRGCAKAPDVVAFRRSLTARSTARAPAPNSVRDGRTTGIRFGSVIP